MSPRIYGYQEAPRIYSLSVSSQKFSRFLTRGELMEFVVPLYSMPGFFVLCLVSKVLADHDVSVLGFGILER